MAKCDRNFPIAVNGKSDNLRLEELLYEFADYRYCDWTIVQLVLKS